MDGLGAKQVLAEAHAAVMGRGEAYGYVENSFGQISELWSWWLEDKYVGTGKGNYDLTPLDPKDVAVMMALMKIARLKLDINHQDSIVDLAGYAACLGELVGAGKAET